jgi:hypothetical protein
VATTVVAGTDEPPWLVGVGTRLTTVGTLDVLAGVAGGALTGVDDSTARGAFEIVARTSALHPATTGTRHAATTDHLIATCWLPIAPVWSPGQTDRMRLGVCSTGAVVWPVHLGHQRGPDL